MGKRQTHDRSLASAVYIADTHLVESTKAGIAESGLIERKGRSARTRRVSCFVSADRWLNRLLRALMTIHEGFWIACLSPDELNAVTAEHFDQSQYFSSPDHNLSGLFVWEASAVTRYFRPGTRVLVAGAGAGREVLALRKAGFDADGFECSLLLVHASRTIFEKAGESSFLMPADPDVVPPGRTTYEGVIVGWTAYTHIPTKRRRIAFLEALHQRCVTKSPLLLSFFVRGSGSDQDDRVRRIAKIFRFFAPWQRHPLELGDRISFARYCHFFTQDEVVAELAAGGFRVDHFANEGDSGYAIAIAE